MLLPPGEAGEIEELLIADDAFAAADPDVREALQPAVERVTRAIGRARAIVVAPKKACARGTRITFISSIPSSRRPSRAGLTRSIRVCPMTSPRPSRTRVGCPLNPAAKRWRFGPKVRARMDALLAGRRVICLPTTPILPPKRDLTLAETAAAGERIVDLTCIAGLTGLPQVSLPLGQFDGLPVGLSLIGWRGGDRALLELAERLGRP